jgi:hypothetical protein
MTWLSGVPSRPDRPAREKEPPVLDIPDRNPSFAALRPAIRAATVISRSFTNRRNQGLAGGFPLYWGNHQELLPGFPLKT